MKDITLHISAGRGADIHSGMFGLFLEDINYGVDGGLNAEMLENPSFSFVEAMGYHSHYSTRPDSLYGWIAHPSGGDGAELSIRTDTPVHENNPHYLHFQASEKQNGVANKAFDGVALKAGMSYVISAYLRSSSYQGSVAVSVYAGGVAVLRQTLAGRVTGDWMKYEVTAVASADTRQGLFVLSTAEGEASAALDVDFVSMKPRDAVYGIFRRDLAELLKDMHPGFLRFPGGCIVEGNELSNRYQWKNTVGPLKSRIANWNRWAVHGNGENEFASGRYSHYNQTCAIGYYEYFLLCEYIGARPLPVQNVGLACQYQTEQRVELESSELDVYIQDVLDLIAFANAPADTEWGGLRAKMGHPAPFRLDMVGIGNEQWETEQSRYFARYTKFEQAIHARYPDVRLIGSAGPDITSEHYTDAWSFYRKKQRANAKFVYAVDEHYYSSPEWMLENDHFYDGYPREIKVFAGEYAAHVRSGMNMPETNTLGAALAEAAFLTGVERNADVVVLAAYAPLFARLGYAQWSPDLVWFDERTCCVTPSYYVQKLYAVNLGSYVVPCTCAGDVNGLYQTVSFDTHTGELIVKLVNASREDARILFEIDEAYQTADVARSTVLAGKKDAYNRIGMPEEITPVESSLPFQHPACVLPAGSFTVLRVQTSRR